MEFGHSAQEREFQEASSTFRLAPVASRGPCFIWSLEIVSAGFQEGYGMLHLLANVLGLVDQQTASALPPREPTGAPQKAGEEHASHLGTGGGVRS